VTHKGNAENPLLGPTTDAHRLKAMIEFLVDNPATAGSRDVDDEVELGRLYHRQVVWRP